MPNAFTRKECDYLEKKGKESFEAHSKDGFHFGEDPLKRSSQISWVDDKMSVAMVEELAHTANIDAGWVLDLVRSEAIQYTVYAEGDEYDWHTDGHQDRYAAKHLVGTSRRPNAIKPNNKPAVSRASTKVVFNSEFELP